MVFIYLSKRNDSASLMQSVTLSSKRLEGNSLHHKILLMKQSTQMPLRKWNLATHMRYNFPFAAAKGQWDWCSLGGIASAICAIAPNPLRVAISARSWTSPQTVWRWRRQLHLEFKEGVVLPPSGWTTQPLFTPAQSWPPGAWQSHAICSMDSQPEILQQMRQTKGDVACMKGLIGLLSRNN